MLTLSATWLKSANGFRLLTPQLCKISTTDKFILNNELFVSREENYFQPPLVIKHGILGSKTNWRSIAHSLCSKGRDVMTVDLRNCGDSPHSVDMTYELMAEDVYRTIKHVLPAELSVDLLGHSMGGKVAMLTALMHPQLINRVVAVDILPTSIVSPGAVFVVKLFEAIREVKLDPKAKSHAAAVNDIFSQLIAKYPDKAVCQWLTTNVGWTKKRGAFWRCNMKYMEANLEHTVRFPEIDCPPFTKPVLFIQGEKSKHMDIPDRDKTVRRFFPNAVFEVIKDAGHWIHADKPHEFIEVVNDFLSQPL